jgi:hypothetical protein
MFLRASIFVLAAMATLASTALVPTSASARPVKAGWSISSGVHHSHGNHKVQPFCRKAGGEQE